MSDISEVELLQSLLEEAQSENESLRIASHGYQRDAHTAVDLLVRVLQEWNAGGVVEDVIGDIMAFFSEPRGGKRAVESRGSTAKQATG